MFVKSSTRARSKALRPAALLLAAVLAVVLLPFSAARAESPALEYKVKAGYLFNFAKFIEWPATAFPKPNSPFVIGVMDGGEAIPVLEPLLSGKLVNGHPVEVRTVAPDRIGKDVHILLVTRASGKTPEELQSALGRATTLLVGETDRFAERGGIIGFVREDESIRLNLNLDAATQAGLKVSAKLSSVARLVKKQRESNKP